MVGVTRTFWRRMLLIGGVLLLALMVGCQTPLARPGSFPQPETGDAGLSAAPDAASAEQSALASALPGTWKRLDGDVFNIYSPDGTYTVENREVDTGGLQTVSYRVVDDEHVRFELPDGGSFILQVELADDTLVYHFPETQYTQAESVTFLRVPEEEEALDEATATAEQTANPSPVLVTFDDFSNPESGWPSGEADVHAYGYQDGGYHIAVMADNLLYHISAPGVDQRDVSIEVDASRIGGTDREMSAAVLCRVTSNPTRFYVFEVTFDGYYTIARYDDGVPTSLGIGYEQSRAIKRGNATNHIRADCIGDTLTLYVNGTRLISLQDDALDSGRVALATASFQNKPEADVLFDNFLVTAPEEVE